MRTGVKESLLKKKIDLEEKLTKLEQGTTGWLELYSAKSDTANAPKEAFENMWSRAGSPAIMLAGPPPAETGHAKCCGAEEI